MTQKPISSKKLDEGWMVIVTADSFLYNTEKHIFTANSQVPGSQGGNKGYASYATNLELQSSYPNQGQPF
jgi:hypothetical protein